MNEPVAQIVVLGWPNSVLDLADLLAGDPQPVYLVGGAVRDAWLRRPIHDLDLISPTGGRKLARRIADHWKGDYYPLDEARDVGRALVDTPEGRLVVDVARMRGESLADDLHDRDFTLNAMAVRLNGALDDLYDPLGGLDDLKAKRLRQCSPHAISDDPIRVLRAVRLSVQFGLRIERETVAAVRAGVPLLARPSAERVRDEWFALLGLPKPAVALRVARSLGVLEAVLPPLGAVQGAQWDRTLLTVERVNDLIRTIGPDRSDETAAQFALGMVVMALDRYRTPLNTHLQQAQPSGRTHQALLTLAALVASFGPAQAAEIGRALRLSGVECDWLERAIAALPGALELREPAALAMHRYWRPVGRAGIDGLLLALAATLAAQHTALDQDAWVRQLEAARLLLWAWFEQQDAIIAPAPLVSGSDLMWTFHLKAGPTIGRLLDALREAQVCGEIGTRDEALALAARLVAE